MAVVIRLARAGAKKMPYYNVVVTDSRNPRDGKYIEVIGAYDPNLEPTKIEFNAERLGYWTKQGATPSETVEGLIKTWNKRGGATQAAVPPPPVAGAGRAQARS